MILSWILFLGTEVFAELKIDSVYPTLGVLGEDLEVTITGSGFDDNTRVSMSLDVGHKKAIIGSVDIMRRATSVTIVGEIAYLTDYYDGLILIDINDPQNPKIIGSVDTPGAAFDVTIAGDKAYVADWDGGLQVIDISNSQSPQIIGSIDTPGDAHGVIVLENKAYICDFAEGLQIIDITNPQNPNIIGSVDLFGSALSVAVQGDLAYVAAWAGDLQIVDVSNPSIPTIISSVETPGGARDIAIIGDKAYVADEWSGLQVIDISNPQNPQIIGSVDTMGLAYGVTVSGDRAYVADYFNGLQIVDVSNLSSPTIIGTVDTPGAAHDVTVVDDKAFIADYDGGLQIVDVSKLSKTNILSSVETGATFALSLVGNTAYVGSNNGFYSIDLTDPASPTVIGSVETLGTVYGITIVGDKAYCVTPTTGLQIIDISNPESPQIIGSVDTPGYAYSVAVQEDKAYVADWDGGLQVVDISNPEVPLIIGSVDTPGDARGVTVVGNEAYVADSAYGLQVIDISNPEKPSIIGSLDLISLAMSVTVKGKIAYVANGYVGLTIIDISTPQNPEVVGSLETPGWSYSVTIVDDKAYVANGSSGVQVVDLRDLTNPILIGSIDTPGSAQVVQKSGYFAFVADYSSGFVIIPLSVEVIPVTVDYENSFSVTLASPNVAGHYNIRVFNENESFELLEAVTFLESDKYGEQQQKKAIIVAGGGPYLGNSLWGATQLSSNFAYLSLLSQGYTRENIYYLSPKTDVDVDGDGLYNDVDIDATIGNLSYAIRVWAKNANELLLFMTDHGGDGTFILNGTKNPIETITAGTLDGWLDEAQMTMPGKVIFIYDACQSGSFLPLLKPPEGKERIVITSSQAEERAWFINGGILSFSYQLWASVFLNANLYDSYTVGKNMMAGNQTPLIDANGNGIADEKEDKTLAGDIIIGRGRVAASTPPIIGLVSGEQTLYGESSATLWVNNIFSLNKITRVGAIIIPPDYNKESSDVPITDLSTIDLVDPDQDGKYEGNYQGFTQKGTYSITIFAMDDQGTYSIPAQTTVIQTVGETVGVVISGTVLIDVAGRQSLGVVNAEVSLQGTAFTTTTDTEGNFVLENVPTGSYILVISAPNLDSITAEIDLVEGQSLSVTLPKMALPKKGDVNGDGKIGLEEAIRALQVISGISPE